MALSVVQLIWIEEVLKTYEQDITCIQLIEKLSVAPTSVTNYTLMNGILRFKARIVIGDNGNMKAQLLQSFHQSALGGHSGERATYHRIKLIFSWPRMKQDVINFVKNYPTCQKNKSDTLHIRDFYNPYPF